MGSRTLGELCTFSRGASVPRARMYENGDYLYVHYGDLYKGFELRIDVDVPQKPIPYITSDERIKDGQWLQDKDIVYVLTSETVDDLGHSFLFNNPENTPAVAGTETTIVRVKHRDLLDPAYLNYLMHTPRFKLLLRQYVKGMKVFRVHPDDISRIEINLPTLNEQERIVALLDALFEQQILAKRVNDYLEQMCQALFDEFDNDDDNPLVPISTIALVNPKRTIKIGEEALCVEMSDLSTSGAFPTGWKVKPYNGGMKFMNGDTVMARITPCLENGKAGYINFLDDEQTAFGSTEYIVMTTKGEIPPEYFYFLARSRDFMSYAIAHMNGSSGRQRVVGADIERYEIRLPNSEQLERFRQVAVPTMQTILANSQESRKLAELRSALLPQLISGEIDVSQIELPTMINNF